MAGGRITTRRIQSMKERGERIPMITAYDYPTARIADEVGIPMILVGDSIGNVVFGYDSTIPVTVDDIARATASVVRGARRSLIIADMPFMSYQVDAGTAVRNAGRLLQEGGAQGVKLEGGRAIAPVIERMSDVGIAVMGHVGLTPQSVHRMGGYRVQGRSAEAAAALIDDAQAVEAAGAFAIVLELIPAELAAQVTERLKIPTIGIGAGLACDGQVQVLHDILGLGLDFKPRHARRYADVAGAIRTAMTSYADDVRAGSFPGDAESFFSDESAVKDRSAIADRPEPSKPCA